MRIRIYDPKAGRYRVLDLKEDIRPNKFERFVEFVLENYGEREPIIPKEVVKREGCPVKDEETAALYLELMQREGLHLKSIYARGKVWFKGCTPMEDALMKRRGLESWVGAKVEDFMSRRPLLGRFMLRRIYEFLEYGEPLFPRIRKLIKMWKEGRIEGSINSLG